MQKLKFVSSIILDFVLAIRGNAQDSERRYWSVEVVEVKANKSDPFEALMKEIAAALADQKYAYSYFVCKSRENKYFTINPKSSIRLEILPGGPDAKGQALIKAS